MDLVQRRGRPGSTPPTGPAVELRGARRNLLDRASLVGPALRDALTAQADRWLIGQLGTASDVALVALGGYGRREPAPGSDLDLLLLHADGVDAGPVADRLWYPIWDAGVPLDHAVRTVSESLTVARTDLRVALGLLDARHLAGDPRLTDQLVGRFRDSWRAHARRRLPELVADATERAARCGELAFLLEPDVKEAHGGLRDVHAIRAVAWAWVGDAPSAQVLAGYRLLLDVRGELHRRLRGRPHDRLLLQEQAAVAGALGYPDQDALMTAVYAAGRAIGYAAAETLRRVRSLSAASRRATRRAAVRRPLADGVVEQASEVVLARGADLTDPVLALRVAAAAAASGHPVARHTLERLAAEAAVPPRPWPPSARQALVGWLGAGPACVPVWEGYDQHGILGRLLPEWDLVRCRPQRNAYHRYTVDRHLVETAAAAAALVRRVSRPDLLLVAGLLHDIGKAAPGDHSAAGSRLVGELAVELGFPGPDVAVLVRLVGQHLLLADTAVRRDLDDPRTIRRVADAVRDRATLGLLHALTEADARATGPAAWSSWKAGLVADLVRRVEAVLAGASPARPERLTATQRRLAAEGRLAVRVEADRITIVAPDRPGLLWRWAGVLALHGLDVRAAAGSSLDGMAVTELQVAPRFGAAPDWERVGADVRSTFDDRLPLAERLAERAAAYRRDRPISAPARVLFVEDTDEATVIEVRAHDRIGLLYRLARSLHECGLDVRQVRVDTLGAEAVDTFYVVDDTGRPLVDEPRRHLVARSLLAAAG